MSTIEKHEPGMFCWLDLATTDVEAAKSFYGGLFGWTAPDQSMDEVRNYGMFKLDGRDVGGLSDLQDAQRQLGVPPHWTLFIAVENADASAAKAKQLGATISVQPFDVSDVGRVASIQDPQGAHFLHLAGQEPPRHWCWENSRHIVLVRTGYHRCRQSHGFLHKSFWMESQG